MTRKENRYRFIYIISDIISSILVSVFIADILNISEHLVEISIYSIITNISIAFISGYYNSVLAKSRLNELATTIISNPISLFLIYKFSIHPYGYWHISLTLLCYAISFLINYIFRVFVTYSIKLSIKNNSFQQKTIVIGEGILAEELFLWLKNTLKRDANLLSKNFASADDFIQKIKEFDKIYDIDEIVLAPQSNNILGLDKMIKELLSTDLYPKKKIYFSARSLRSMSFRSRITSLFGEDLISIDRLNMGDFSQNLKFIFDKIVSLSLLIFLSPIFLLIAILIKLDSKGDIIYKQERVGLHSRKFTIYKFRTMIENAEPNGPVLSKDGDNRISKIGTYLRKYRLDELPQFYNVLIGDMSIIGPRPEREFFEKQIIEIAPEYRLIHNIKPGITSWGIVQYGYASSVDEMLERFDYDWIYYENMSLFLDFSVLIYTIRTIIKGLGK